MQNEKKTIENIFAKKIKMLRVQKNLSQSEFGKLLGFHFTHISRYERGDALPSIEGIIKIAKKLKVSIDYLLFDDKDSILTDNIHDPDLLEAFFIIDELKGDEKKFAKKMLQAIILQHQITKPILGNNKK